MSSGAITIVFIIAWWMVFFMTLPFGAKTPEEIKAGRDDGAPERPRLALKALISALIAAAITGAVAMAVDYNLVDFRGLLK